MKSNIERLKDVIKALDLLEGTEAKISVRVTFSKEVAQFINELRSKDYRLSYTSVEDYMIIVTFDTKLCRIPDIEQVNF